MKYLKSKKLLIAIGVVLASSFFMWIYEKNQAENLAESEELSRVLDSLGLQTAKSTEIDPLNLDSGQLDSLRVFHKDSVYKAYRDSVFKMKAEIKLFLDSMQLLENKGFRADMFVWQPEKIPLSFRQAKGLTGSVSYRVFYSDSTKINELKKWESSLGVSIKNIFYLSQRNQWNLPHLTRMMKKNFNEILPEKWISSVEIIHIELSPVEND